MDIARLAALLVLGCVFSPFLRGIALICAGAAVLALAGLLVYRIATKHAAKPPAASICASTPAAPKLLTESDLIERLHAIDWFQFEQVMAVICRNLGYAVTRRGGANPDGGIDLVLEKVGERRAVQCKHWKTREVGVRHVREFLGALADAGMPKGSFITLTGYTRDAAALAERHGIEMVGERELFTMLKAGDVINDPEIVALLTDARKYCPKCEREMVLRTASRGSNAGTRFWGCSAYPSCRYTMPA